MSRCPLILRFFFFLFFFTIAKTEAQHLIRKKSLYAPSASLIELKPIQNVEIVTLNSSLISNSYFTLPLSPSAVVINSNNINNNNFILYYSFTFVPYPFLPQIPFSCGTPQFNCRTMKCYLTCANTTYSLALRCKDPAFSSTFRTVAITQEAVQESFDDEDQITLKVNQRLEGGSVCQFSFANNLLGRRTVGGRLRGYVILSAKRSFPQFSGIPFHPDPALWNETKSSSAFNSSISSLPSAYVRCATTGKVTFVQDPRSSSTVGTALTNWTDACCFDSSKKSGNCSVAYSNASTPAFYFKNHSASTSSLIVWTKPESKISSSAQLVDSLCDVGTSSSSAPKSSSGVLALNISRLLPTAASTDYLLKESIFSILEMIPNNHPNRDAAAGIGLFRCYDDSSVSTSSSSTTSSFIACVAFASNRSIWIAKPNAQFSGVVESSSGSSVYIPICAASNDSFSTTSSSSSTSSSFSSPLGPIDDASSFYSSTTTTTISAVSPSVLAALPQGSCFNIKNPLLCTSPCVWSSTFGTCLWGDPAALSTSSPVQTRSTTCAWTLSPPAIKNLSSDLVCSVPRSDSTLSTLLATLCLERGFSLNQVSWCVQSAFACSALEGSIEQIVDKLMAYSCLGAVVAGSAPAPAACADSSLSCSPNASSSSLFATLPAGFQTMSPPIFELSVVTNRSEISVTSEIRSTTAASAAAASTSNPYYVSIGVFLVGTGAYFNLTAIRRDLAANGRNGFVVRVPGDSTNHGRFSLDGTFLSLFPDPDFAITDIAGNGKNTTLSDSLVIRISKTNAFKPLPGTRQYLDVNPRRQSAGNYWMSPTNQYSFAPFTISFFEEPEAESCSFLGLAIAVVVFGLLSGLGGWIIVGAVQATLAAAQSSCASDRIRHCASETISLVQIGRIFWLVDGDEVIGDYHRKVFWTQFLILVVVLVLHMLLVRVYKYFAPLKGSPERTLWFPAPTYFLCGLFAVGTVQTAWVVIFSDALTVLRVLSFFCFAALLGTILPWWFLKTFREEENYFQSYDFTSLFKNNHSIDSGSDFNRKEQQQQKQRTEDANSTRGKNSRRRTNEKRDLEGGNDDDDDNQKDIFLLRHHQHHHHNHYSPPAPRPPSILLQAETTNISLRHAEHMQRKRDKNKSTWSARDGKCAYLAVALFLPVGWWPHTKGMAPVRDLIHPKASFFPWVSLIILGLTGLNFSYVGVAVGLCSANYFNHAILQAIWIGFTVYWRPFRLPILNAVWIVARILDFANAIDTANWLAEGVPATRERSQTMANLIVASLIFMLIFALLSFLVKVKEAINNLLRESDSTGELQHDERALDFALHEIILSNRNNNNNNNNHDNMINRQQQQRQGEQTTNEDSATSGKKDFFDHEFIITNSGSGKGHQLLHQQSQYQQTSNNISVAASTVAILSAIHSVPFSELSNDQMSPLANDSRPTRMHRNNNNNNRDEKYYNVNYYDANSDFDPSPRIEKAEREMYGLFSSPAAASSSSSNKDRGAQPKLSCQHHRIEIWWDSDGPRQRTQHNDNYRYNSDFDDDDDSSSTNEQNEQELFQREKYGTKEHDNRKTNENSRSRKNSGSMNVVDIDMVRSRSQRTANLLSAFSSLVKVHEIPPNLSLPSSISNKSSTKRRQQSKSDEDDDDDDDGEDEDDEENNEEGEADQERGDDENQKEFRLIQRLQRKNERRLVKRGLKEHDRLERQRNKLRRKGYRLIVTFSNPRDAVAAARSLIGKIDDPSGTRIFCELLPDNV